MLRQILADEWRFLTFRQPSSALREHWKAYLCFGLVFTWLAGVGRYWDNPRAYSWQHLGLGSVAYVFVLALILWALLAPLRPRSWSYRNVLLFVTLTSPPALLYAVPVERFLSMDSARSANAWFLGIVALWRVALYSTFLRRVAGLRRGSLVIGTLLPLVLIVVTLAILNLEHVVFELMSGIHESDQSPNDGAYQVVLTLSFFSFLTTPFLVAGYCIAVYYAWRQVRRPKPDHGAS